MKGDNLSRKVTPEVILSLQDIVGKDNVNTNEMDRMLYGHDLAPLPKEAGLAFKNMPDVIVRPSNAAQVSEIVKIAYKNGIAVVPRGNSTWGLGGSMPTAGGILLDMAAKMNEIIEIDTVNMSARVQAGCTWKKVLDACEKEGFLVGSYPSSFPSATVGAWFSTGGIGIGGYKYGSAKDNCLNLQVALSNGDLIETGYDKIASNMSGYNLTQLFGGAEGTLGVITEVTLRIYPRGIVKPIAYEFASLRDMGEPINKIVNHASLKPLHIAWSDYNHFENQRKAGLHAPEVKNVFLVTLQGDEEFVALEEKVLDAIVEECGGKKLSYEIAEHEWEERCYEFRARKTGVGSIPAEVVVTNENWAKFVDECYEGYKTMKMEAGGIIGMVADRSTSMFMPYYFKDDESLLGMTAFSYNFYMGDRAAEYGGRSLGLGVFFASNLDSIHDEGCVSLMRDLKTFLDPHDVINPGHLVCGKTKFGIALDKNIMGIAGKLMQSVKKVLPENKTFAQNGKRFHYDDMEEEKEHSREVEYGVGTQ
ncbi:MAG: FAD-binding oxidoreductase [Candidatus Methanomethylophilaceae archaeon]|nr:FAD-binding oxidoreductase [Candidatus Methanomethylophilaceae archaeon]